VIKRHSRSNLAPAGSRGTGEDTTFRSTKTQTSFWPLATGPDAALCSFLLFQWTGKGATETENALVSLFNRNQNRTESSLQLPWLRALMKQRSGRFALPLNLLRKAAMIIRFGCRQVLARQSHVIQTGISPGLTDLQSMCDRRLARLSNFAA
jgi:hypothetical protein